MRMRIFSALQPRRPLDRSKACVCLITNLLVTPGLGTLMAGRLVTGLIVLAIAVTGFVLLMLWFFQLFRILFQLQELSLALPPYAWMWKSGLFLFSLSWILALASSISILRQTAPPGTAPPALKKAPL